MSLLDSLPGSSSEEGKIEGKIERGEPEKNRLRVYRIHTVVDLSIFLDQRVSD